MKLVCISDTHNQHNRIKLPDGDVLVHAGDFTNAGTKKEAFDFIEWFACQPHQHKVLVHGNHDVGHGVTIPPEINVLHGTGTVVAGLTFWGHPGLPAGEHGGEFDTWFESDAMWTIVPPRVDVLVTHAPPYGVLDGFIGNEELLVHVVDRITPRVHIFGHYHPGRGVAQLHETTFVNAAMCVDTWTGPVLAQEAIEFEF
jgi:Icc-related predicted phosphoesterase